MGHDNENNRSTALTPELIAMITAATAAAVKETMAGMREHNETMIRELALTPEKLREANKPYVDPDVANRALRDKLKFKREEIEQEKNRRLTRDNCTHHYPDGRLIAISPVRNFPDRQERGICMLCHEWFTPREWRIDDPGNVDSDKQAHMFPQHPQYALVLKAIRQKEGQ
jgi:hypothetical protein